VIFHRRAITISLILLGLSLMHPAMAWSDPPAPAETAHSNSSGVVTEAACRIIEEAARASHIPVALLTRLVWTESRFRADAISPKGAQGIAQFMPGTAAERGLLNPFDPEQAIPKAAKLLADLTQQFGNLGLAAAAYNAGANRVADWLAGSGSLPAETQLYVLIVSGRSAEDWAADRRQSVHSAEPEDQQSCSEITAALRSEENTDLAPIAPWGVQLSGNFSKPIALASFERARQRYSRIIGDLQPMIIGSVLRSRGTRRFYRVLLPAASRAQADRLCNAILAQGGACVALRS
jgi:hypothetical protein